MRSTRVTAISDAQRAKLLGVSAGGLVAIATPIVLSPAFPGGVDPGAQVAFNRIKKGKTHLVEFYVTLNMNVAYKFRVFTYPLGDFVDVTIQGPKSSTVIAALAPPVDQISGTLELGASIRQRNTAAENAGWSLQSVQVNTVG